MTSRIKIAIVTMSTCVVAILLLGATMGKSASPEDTYRHLAVYTEVLSRIKSEYVEEPDMKNVTIGAVNGLLESIDPYASYLSPEQYKQYQATKNSEKAGVGLLLSRKFGYISVVEAIPGSPAAKAGLNTGDMLETIKGVSTRDMPLAFADLLLAGDPGTTIEVAVLRVRKPEPQKITLTRAVVAMPPVTSKLMADKVGYIQVQSLDSGKVKDVAKAVESLRGQGAQKLVLDLRNCATGKPEEGVPLANLFIEKGVITYSQGQRMARSNSEADPSKTIWKQPMVVITNRGTASGAEIATAALLDSKRAQVVGERTYGDAAVRKAVTLDDGSAIILSVAKFYSPSGKAIQDVAVTPTVQMQEIEPPADDDDTVPPEEKDQHKGEDLLLKKAVELLSAGSAVAANTSR